MSSPVRKAGISLWPTAHSCILAFGIFQGAYAQAPTPTALADFLGEWEGETGTKVALHLTLGSDGRYALHWLTGPGAGSIPRGSATLAGGSLVLKYRDGEMALAKTSQDTLAGTYFTEKSKGPVTFTKVAAAPSAPTAKAQTILCGQKVDYSLATPNETPAGVRNYLGIWSGTVMRLASGPYVQELHLSGINKVEGAYSDPVGTGLARLTRQ